MKKIIVMGASKGGVAALRTIVRALPKDFDAPMLVVQHVGDESMLPSVLNDVSALPARHAKDGDLIEAGQILVAPPNHHMLVTDGGVELTRGPRENWSRPALDPLFRTAAAAYGEAVIGVVLTGRLNDGTAGLFEIKRLGGVAIVQEPSEAEAPSMPQSALANVAIDHRLPLRKIAGCLLHLVDQAEHDENQTSHGSSMREFAAALGDTPLAPSWPECGGVMREDHLGPIMRFRCHIGHRMTAEVLAAAQSLVLENQLAACLRLLKERAELCRDIARKEERRGDTEARDAWASAAQQAQVQAEKLRPLTEAEWRHPEAPREQHR